MVQRIIITTLSALFYMSNLLPQCAIAGWKVPFNGSHSEPVVYEGLIYIGSFDGAISAIDPKSGKQIWQYQTGENLPQSNVIYTSEESPGEMLGTALDATSKKSKGKRQIDATPIIEDGVVYVGSRDHKFYAIDAKSGKLIWVTDIAHPIFQEALLIDENIIVHAPYAVYVLRKKDGQVMWSTEGQGTVSYPFSNGKVVYYGLSEDAKSSHSFMNAVELNTGKLLWTLELQGYLPKRVYSSAELVYATTLTGGELIHNADNTASYAPQAPHVYAVNASSGKLIWEFKGGNAEYSPPPLVIESNYIFFTATEGLYALDKNTGKQDWFLKGTFSPYNITIGKLLYVNGDSMEKNNRFYAIDPKTGKVIWSHRYKDLFYTRLHDDTVYVTEKRSLVALNATTGKTLWKYKAGGSSKYRTSVSALPLIFESQLIFPTETNIIWGRDDIQGHLYSIDTQTGKVN